MLLEFERDLDDEKYKPENMIGTKGVGKVPGGNGGKFQERESASWEGAAHQRGNDMASSGGTDPPIYSQKSYSCLGLHRRHRPWPMDEEYPHKKARRAH